MLRTLNALLTTSLVMASQVLASPPKPTLPGDEVIRQILVQRIDAARQATGIVVGVVAPTGRRIISHGVPAIGDGRPLNGDTVFEIGSVTKVFTSLLLADMVQRGEVSLDEPLAALLPDGKVRVPERKGEPIRLVDLSTQSSGLPQMPDDFRPIDFGDPYRHYSVEQLYAFLSAYSLPRAPGAKYEYSNLGVGLLGHALALRAGSDYETLVRERIVAPLGMSATGVTHAAAPVRPRAVGHSWALEPVDHWTSPTLTGAGFLSSTANDLLTLLQAFIGDRKTVLDPAMKAMVATLRSGGIPPAQKVALGWMVSATEQGEFFWHPGRTGGYQSFVGYDPGARVGVVVLANANTRVGITDIGLHLLDSRSPLAAPKPPRFGPPMILDEREAERLVGRYEWTSEVHLSVTRESSRLFLQVGGPRKFELFADGAGGMFMKDSPGTVSFDEAASGPARAVIVRLYGREYRAWRTE